MAATFDSTLRSSVDWVRLYIRDTGPSFRLQDETIAAVLAKAQNKWLAAADLFQLSLASVTDSSVKEKIIENLHITYGGRSTDTLLQKHYEWLRQKGIYEAMPRPKILESL